MKFKIYYQINGHKFQQNVNCKNAEQAKIIIKEQIKFDKIILAPIVQPDFKNLDECDSIQEFDKIILAPIVQLDFKNLDKGDAIQKFKNIFGF